MRRLALYRAPLLAAMAAALGACEQTENPLAPMSAPESPALARKPGGQTAKVRIAFSIFALGGGGVYTVNTDGTGYKAVPNTEQGFAPAWSPDRRKLAFTRLQSEPGLYVINANGTKRNRLFVGDAWGAKWSPDGSQIAFYARANPGFRVMVVRADGTDLRQLTPSDGASYNSPSWSPDGARIAYEVYDTYGSEVWVMNADGTSPAKILDCATLAVQCSSPAWSPAPGDERIAIKVRDGDVNALATIHADGTSWQTVLYGAEHETSELRPAWSPDATQFVFTAHRNGETDLFIVDADGSNVRQVTSAPGVESFPAWSR